MFKKENCKDNNRDIYESEHRKIVSFINLRTIEINIYTKININKSELGIKMGKYIYVK